MDSAPEESPQESLSSSELFALMQKAESVSEYRDLFNRYWEKRKAEGIRPSEAPSPGPEAQRSAQRPQKSRGRERKAASGAGRRRES